MKGIRNTAFCKDMFFKLYFKPTIKKVKIANQSFRPE